MIDQRTHFFEPLPLPQYSHRVLWPVQLPSPPIQSYPALLRQLRCLLFVWFDRICADRVSSAPMFGFHPMAQASHIHISSGREKDTTRCSSDCATTPEAGRSYTTDIACAAGDQVSDLF